MDFIAGVKTNPEPDLSWFNFQDMKIRHLFLFCTLIIGCAGRISSNQPKLVYEDGYHFGHLNKSIIQEHDAYTWFPKQYDNYQPMLERIDTNALNETNIVVFMGTWCHDSKREVPRLYKILDEINYDYAKFEIIGLKNNKTGYFKDYSNFNVKNTPTIIFFQNKREIGRIIEKPKKSLESDIQKILNEVQ